MSAYWAPYAPAFTYNPQAGFVYEFTRLARHMGWGKRSARYRDERTHCFELEILVAFGDGSNLEKWQRLCEEVGIEEIPTSIKGCRKVLNRTWVNIVDLMLSRASNTLVHQFPSELALRNYTKNHKGKVFPKKAAKADGFVKDLLITL